MKYRTTILAIASMTIITASSVALAVTVPSSYAPLAPLPDVTSPELTFATKVDFSTYVRYAYNLLIAVAGVASVFMIIWGGFEYMTSDAVSGKKDGLAKVKNAIYGLLLILSSWLILRTIDPRFVNISNTIVPPLNIQVANTVNDVISIWQQEMNAISAEFQNQTDSAIAEKNAAKNQVIDLQNQLDQANAYADRACTNGTEAECDEALNEVDIIKNKLSEAKSNFVVKSYLADSLIIGNIINSGGDAVNGKNGSNTNTFQQSSDAVLTKAIAANTKEYNATIKALVNDPEATQVVKLVKKAIDNQNLIQQQYIAYNPENGSSPIKAADAIKNIKKLQDQVNSSYKEIQNPDEKLKSIVDQINQTAKTYIEKIDPKQAGSSDIPSIYDSSLMN